MNCKIACALLALCFGIGGLSARGEEKASTGLPAVKLDGNYFERGGKRFLPVGVNWVPAKAAMQWPYQWDSASIEADFAQMHALGVNTVRLDLVWAWFEPRPGQYNEEAFRQVEYLITLAKRYHIYLHPCLLIGGEVGEAYWDVPYRQGRHPHADPEMLRLETDFAGEIARRFGKTKEILSWDLTDEPPFWIVTDSTTDAMAINWTRLITGALHKYGDEHPLVVGTSMEDVAHGPFRPDDIRDDVDFFSVHPYTIYAPKLFPDPMLSTRGSYGAAFETALSGGAGKPVMIQEMGASSAQYSPEVIATFEATQLYTGLGAGANGFLIWCYTDAAPEQYQKVPYLRAPHETQFGLVTWDRKPRPAAGMFTAFTKITGKMDLAGIEPAPAQAAILVPQEWSKPYGDASHFGLNVTDPVPYTSTMEGGSVSGQSPSSDAEGNLRITGAWLTSYILARQAQMKADFPREYGDWQKRPLVLMPSPLTSTEDRLIHLHTDFWAKAKTYVEKGGALYASLSGESAIPEMEQLFGARLVDREPVTEVTLKVVAPFGDLKPGEEFHYSAAADSPATWAATLEVRGGKVIAVDQDGRPALIAHQLGEGQTLLCAYPIESYLAAKPSAFEKGEPTYRIYEALRQSIHLHAPFESGNSAIEASLLSGEKRGYVVLVNHSNSKQTAKLTSTAGTHRLWRMLPDEDAPVSAGGTNSSPVWTLELEPFQSVVLRWE